MRLSFYNQAAQIEPENATLAEKIEPRSWVEGESRQSCVASWPVPRRRHRSDFAAASQLIDQALALDETQYGFAQRTCEDRARKRS